MGRYDYYGFSPYVPVAERRARAARQIVKRLAKGESAAPVRIEGRIIASTFWGKAWCTNLEGYSDFSNRLPRGRTYARNGSVVHLAIEKGTIKAFVSGSELYEIRIEIATLASAQWQAIKKQSAGQIGTLVELLQGKLSQGIMKLVTDPANGLFPKPKEIKMRCSCPDSARLCKHLAAVLYGIGNRLDTSPELLFLLRGVDHLELIEQAIPAAPLNAGRKAAALANDDLGAIFDIELDADVPPAPETKSSKPIDAPAIAKKARAAAAARATKKVRATEAEKATRSPVKKAASRTEPTVAAPAKRRVAAPAKPATKVKGKAKAETKAPSARTPSTAAAKKRTAKKRVSKRG